MSKTITTGLTKGVQVCALCGTEIDVGDPVIRVCEDYGQYQRFEPVSKFYHVQDCVCGDGISSTCVVHNKGLSTDDA